MQPRPVEVSHRKVLSLAIPMTLAHVTEPLVGFVGLAVIGQLNDAALLGAITIGAVLFDFVFWPFAFLRMGTAGLTAQAVGADDLAQQRLVLLRAVLLGALCAGFLLILSIPVREAGLWLSGGSDEVQAATRRYFTWRIWSAPFVFMNFALLGWLIGIGRTGLGLLAQLIVNLTNIFAACALTLGLGFGVEGLASAAILSEAVGVVVSALFVAKVLSWRFIIDWPAVLAKDKLTALIAMNRDIMLRSVLLLGGFLFFTRQGAASGDVVVAANGLLMNLFLLGAYTLDGFATAAEQLCGQALGARNLAAFSLANRLTRLWSLAYGAVIGLLFYVAGPGILSAMTGHEAIRNAALDVLPLAALTPLAGALAFQLDGIFIGATWTGAMRNMMFLSFSIYVATFALFGNQWGNHGLWVSFLIFLLARGISLAVIYPRELKRSFSQGS